MIMTYEWKNQNGEVAVILTIDDVLGLEMKLNNEECLRRGKEIEEMQTLNMYPPVDENNLSGTKSDDGHWTTYKTKPGKKWDFAKQDIVATFNFWMNGLTNLTEQ